MYTLYNQRLKKPLLHPQVGLWYTDNYQEAQDLLNDFHDLVKDMGQPELIPDLVIREVKEE